MKQLVKEDKVSASRGKSSDLQETNEYLNENLKLQSIEH